MEKRRSCGRKTDQQQINVYYNNPDKCINLMQLCSTFIHQNRSARCGEDIENVRPFGSPRPLSWFSFNEVSTTRAQEFRALVTCADDNDERPPHLSSQQITMGTASHVQRHGSCSHFRGPPRSKGWRMECWWMRSGRVLQQSIVFDILLSDYSFNSRLYKTLRSHLHRKDAVFGRSTSNLLKRSAISS